MQLKFVSIMVTDQLRALAFHTVTSPDGIAGVELVLEPMAFPPAKEYQRAMLEAGIPATADIAADIAADVVRLTARGVKFRGAPKRMGPITAVDSNVHSTTRRQVDRTSGTFHDV